MSINRIVCTKTSYFGEFARNEIKTEIEKYHFKKAFLVSDKDLEKCGVVLKIEKVLKENNTPYKLDLEVKPNPIENVHYGLELFKKSNADLL